MKLFPAVILLLISMLAACGGKGESVNRANELFQQNQNAQAVAVLTKAADDDYIDAQVRLAKYYEDLAKQQPNQAPQHESNARLWYQRAIRNGSPEAEYHFGMLSCNNQIRSETSDEQCQFWLESAARKGNVDAQVELANRYFSRKDDSVALLNAEFWAEQAAPKSLAAANLVDKIQYEKIRDMKSVEWVVAQDPNDYTIQLNLFAELYDAIDYAFNWGLKGAAIYEDKMGNFGVVAGVYDNEATGNAEIKLLPDDLTSMNTQAISFAQLREFIPQDKLELAQQQNKAANRNQSVVVEKQPTAQAAAAPAAREPAQSNNATAAPASDTRTTTIKARSEANNPTNQTTQSAPTNTAQESQEPPSLQEFTPEQRAYIEEQQAAYKKLKEITQGDSWLQEHQQAGRYSVVLVREVTPSQALRFIELTGISGAYAQLMPNGTIYLLAGAYDTQDAAQTEVQNLPESFLQFDPRVVDTRQLQQ